MHVALGWKYRGHRVRQGPVVCVCLEGQRTFRKWKEAFRKAKLEGDEDPPFFLIVNPLSLAADRTVLVEDIKRQLGKDLPAVVCIDTLNRSLLGSESTWGTTSRPPTLLIGKLSSLRPGFVTFSARRPLIVPLPS
jgi:hypothetical protein